MINMESTAVQRDADSAMFQQALAPYAPAPPLGFEPIPRAQPPPAHDETLLDKRQRKPTKRYQDFLHSKFLTGQSNDPTT